MPAGTAAFSLAGQSALVIGGGSGIGRAIAIGLAGAGAKVSVAGRRKDWLEEAIGAIGTKGAPASPIGSMRASRARSRACSPNGRRTAARPTSS